MFVLIGYSFGSLIAIELAKQLEDRGFNGRLVLFDGAPQLMKAMMEQYMPSSTREELQNNVLLSIMDVLTPAASGKVNFACDSFCDSVKIIIINMLKLHLRPSFPTATSRSGQMRELGKEIRMFHLAHSSR